MVRREGDNTVSQWQKESSITFQYFPGQFLYISARFPNSKFGFSGKSRLYLNEASIHMPRHLRSVELRKVFVTVQI